MASVENTFASGEESPFEVIPQIDRDRGRHPQGQQLRNPIKTPPLDLSPSVLGSEGSASILRLRRQGKRQSGTNKGPQLGSENSAAGVSVPHSNKQRMKRGKSKAESDFEFESESEPTSVGEDDFDSRFKVKVDLEKEILNLKATVEYLMEKQGQGQGQLEKSGNTKSCSAGDGKDKVGKGEIKGTRKNKCEEERPEKFTKSECGDGCFLAFLILLVFMFFGLIITFRGICVSIEKVEQGFQRTIRDTLKENFMESLRENAKARRRVNHAKNSVVEEETQKQSQTQNDISNSIHLYSQKNFKGSLHVVHPWQLNENSCYNLENTGDNFASSIDTQGECVYAFQDSDCRRNKIKLSSETIDHHDLDLWGLDKKISSLQACHKVKE